ncbi:MAG: tRNA lysidine(34) synthetase TilS [Anaerolinea sp.]|mgnify:CR=1 FL=1|nr:tRNA lysidine(34) synthetase TilS [Anaerolinea sp.]
MQLERVQKVFEQDCGLHQRAPVLVGVSGGPDSLCLLDLLIRAGYAVVVAHLNHGLRAEAEMDAAYVQRVAEGYGVACRIGQRDVRKVAEAQHLSIEEAARLLRYRFLFEQARTEGAQAVVVGHTADDQVETVLMHLLRGAGVDGLCGMAMRSCHEGWDASIPLVRPLLGVGRVEVEAYCAERGLNPVRDSSNWQREFYRNRLRHELLPELETYNPQVRQALWRMSQVVRGDAELLAEMTETSWLRLVKQETAGQVHLRGSLAELQRPLLRRVLRRAVSSLRPDLRDVDFEAIERAADFVYDPRHGRQVELPGHLQLLLENDSFVLLDVRASLKGDWPQVAEEAGVALPIPGEMRLAGGWCVRAERVEPVQVQELAQGMHNPYEAWLDAESVCDVLWVRRRRAGDRFQPLGMENGTQKVSDFMVNKRLPRRARAGWPLICCGDEVVWLPGYRPGHKFRLKETTQAALHLVVFKQDTVRIDGAT